MLNSRHDNDDSITNDNDSDMPTRRRKKPNQTKLNPLAAARPKLKTHESIWHVKSGAGYQLFCSYYRNQCSGVVCLQECTCGGNGVESSEIVTRNKTRLALATTTSSRTSSTITPLAPTTARGLSRASKRRGWPGCAISLGELLL